MHLLLTVGAAVNMDASFFAMCAVHRAAAPLKA